MVEFSHGLGRTRPVEGNYDLTLAARSNLGYNILSSNEFRLPAQPAGEVRLRRGRIVAQKFLGGVSSLFDQPGVAFQIGETQ